MSVVVGFDVNRKKRTETLRYFNQGIKDKVNRNIEENEILLPKPTAIAIGNIQVEEINVFFDMKTKQNLYPLK